MKELIKIPFAFISVLLYFVSTAQPKTYSTQNAHSHNNYVNPIPFYLAFNNGFGSIEADVFPVNGILLVAHKKGEMQFKNTLASLYINPILHEFTSLKPRDLKLLIDIKENYEVSLALLISELEPLKMYLSSLTRPKYLTIIITGLHPPPGDYKNYPDFIFFDDNLKLPHNNKEWERVALVSLPFNKISGWNGENTLKRNTGKY
jgi:alkaline phosphatase